MVPSSRAHLLLFIAQITWANANGCRWAIEQYLDPSHPDLLKVLRSKGYDDTKVFEEILGSFGYLSDADLHQAAYALLQTPPF
jgi:hypothetical protein